MAVFMAFARGLYRGVDALTAARFMLKINT
jgi:hypothetical protein